MRSCPHPLHLTRDDRRFLRSLRLLLWPCPGCEPDTCPHPDELVEYKAHLDALVCPCGARKRAIPGAEWRRGETDGE